MNITIPGMKRSLAQYVFMRYWVCFIVGHKPSCLRYSSNCERCGKEK